MHTIDSTLYPNLAAAQLIAVTPEHTESFGSALCIVWRGADLYIEREGRSIHLPPDHAEAEAMLKELGSAEDLELIERVLATAPSFSSLQQMYAQLKRAPGAVARIGSTLYAVAKIDDLPQLMVAPDSCHLVKIMAAQQLRGWLDVMRGFMDVTMQKAADAIKNAPLYETIGHATDDEALLKHPLIRVGSEASYSCLMRNTDGNGWNTISRPKTVEDAGLEDADDEVRNRASMLATEQAAELAPQGTDGILEVVDTSYPNMFDAEGQRLPAEEGAALHAAYLDVQKRVMLTKSAMIAFQSNSEPHTQFKQEYLEMVLLQRGDVVVSELENKLGFTCTVELDGIMATLTDSHYHTLLIRVLHFMTTRHDPDTDKYVNSQLRNTVEAQSPLKLVE